MKLLLSFLLLFSASIKADAVVYSVNELRWSQIYPSNGACTIDLVTEVVSSVSGPTCKNNFKGKLGVYRIVATPNKTVNVTISDRLSINNGNDGIDFVPAGTLVSDTESHAIIPNTIIAIDSGVSGEITVKLGGDLYISQEPAGSRTTTIDVLDGITATELP